MRQRGPVAFPGLRRKLEADVLDVSTPPSLRNELRACQGCQVFTELPLPCVPQVTLGPRCPDGLFQACHTIFRPLRASSPRPLPPYPLHSSIHPG